MEYDPIVSRYLTWIIDIIYENQEKEEAREGTYRDLIDLLYNIDFYYLMDLDGDRADDGCDLRYRFGDETHIDHRIIANHLDRSGCSVLEMMIALALRCEESIMYDYDEGRCAGRWFWRMIDSLGLSEMTDDNFDESYIRDAIDKFLNRDYDRDGYGGLFAIEGYDGDLRKMTIWSQMSKYLTYVW